MSKRRMSLKIKLIGFIVLLLAIANIGLGIPSYIVARNELEEKGKTILKNGVNMAISTIESAGLAVEAGIISEEEAKERVRGFLVGPMQEDGKRTLTTPIDLGEHGYFLAYNDEGYEVMHPTIEGTYVYDVVSFGEEEVYIVKEQLRIGRLGGFLEYNWHYPDSDNIGRKFSYSKYEPRWGWTVVATAYASDFNQAANNIMYFMIVLFLVTLFFIVLFANHYMDQVLAPILRIIHSMKKYEKNKLVKVEGIKKKDELMDLTNGYNQMVDSLQYNINQLKSREKELKKLAYIDDLTGLPNMNMMEEFVDRQIEVNNRIGYLLLLDIKELKMINSIYGLSYGDDMIKIIAEGLRHRKPGYKSLVARLGGNEFGIWINDDDEDLVLKWIEDTHQFWNQEYYTRQLDVRVGFSVAYVRNDELNENFERILQKANIAMQYAKAQGLNQAKYSQEIFDMIESESVLKRHAESGLENDEFYPVYQEKVSMVDERVVGVEALARWESKVLGFVSPGVFIPIMNKTKMILDFTEKMVTYVFKDFEGLTRKYGHEVSVSINISPLFFMSDNFVSYMLEKASEYKVPTHCIILEITEDILIGNLDKVNTRVKALRKAGMKISLDDFGTGYSSLNYLQKITLDEIKIDKSFIDHIVDDPMSNKLFHSIIDVINNFGCDTVAEGVETKDQIDIVKSAGCKVVQGYYYSKPEKLII